MNAFTYTGLTAFIKNTPETNEAFRVLAEAIPQMKAYTGEHNESFELFDHVMNSAAYTHIQENSEILSPCQAMLPHLTPSEYREVVLTSEEIKDVFMTRLYIPVAAIDADAVKHMTHECIRPVLMTLFGDNLVGIKTKTAMEHDDFYDVEPTVLLSAQRRAAHAGI